MVEKTDSTTARGYLERYIRAELVIPRNISIIKAGTYPVSITGIAENPANTGLNPENTVICRLIPQTGHSS